MTSQQQDDISRKILAAIMLKDFASTTATSRHMHKALAEQAESVANKLLEI